MIADRSNAEHYFWGEDCEGWHLLKSEALSVIEEKVPPGRSEKRHFHARARQFFYILSGNAVLEIDGKKFEMTAGQSIEVPPGARHQFINQSDEAVEFLVISAPPTGDDRTDL
ncbi:MAG: cupin domain-containing protein [Pyrinomonadaceae bacterium]